MGIESLSEAAHKVDEAVSRLQKLQCAIASEIPAASSSTRMLRRSNRRNRPELQSFDQLTRRPSSIKLGDLDPSGGGSEADNYCRRWSSPGESLHQTVSDILVASKFAKEVAGLVARSLENGKESPTRGPKSQVQPDVVPNKQKKDITKPVEVAVAAATSARKAWRRENGKENSNPSRHHGLLLQAKQVTREQPHLFKGSSLMNIRQGNIGQPNNIRQGNDKIITRKEKVESKSNGKGEMGQRKTENLTPRRFKTPTQVKPLMGGPSSTILGNKKMAPQTLPSSSSCSSYSNESCPLYPKQRAKASVGVPNRRTPCKSAKVSALPLKTETRFCINVGETATTANRPWSLARNKPSKLEPMFPSKMANTQRPSPPPIIPSPRLKQISPKDPQTPPILLSRRVSKLSPIRGIRLHSVKSPKLFLPVSESRANNKHRSSSVCFKLMSPRRSPRQSSILSEKKKKQGGFLTRRFSLDPSKGFRKISLLAGGVGGKHDVNSPVRKPPPPLPSLITRLPSRGRYSNNGSSTPFSYRNQQPTSRFRQDCITTSKDLLLLPKVKDFSSPLPVPPAIRAQQLREEAKAQRIGSAIIKEGRGDVHIDDAVGEKKMEADESEHNPLGGCSGSVWPVLKRSWSLSNLNGRGKVHSSPVILKQNKIGSNDLRRSLKVEKNWAI